MEQFFTPTHPLRYQNLFDDDGPFVYSKVELAVPMEDFLVHHWDWETLCAFVSGDILRKIMWITKDAFLLVEESDNVFRLDYDSLRICVAAKIEATSGQEQELMLATITGKGIPKPVPTGACNVFWRAITISNIVQLSIQKVNDSYGLPSGPVLSQFLRGTPSLQVLAFRRFGFMEALATLERTDLQITFDYCTLELQKETFIEWFRHN
jgi:hypothetical protein